MNALTAEWVAKAEGDFVTTGRELNAPIQPNYDASCFHAQQAAEKYLKAFLTEHRVVPPRTHDLIELLELCLQVHPDFESLRHLLVLLSGYAIRFRYPGDWAIESEAQRALAAVTSVRAFVRQQLGLP